ncbi:PREDICTED: DNA-directed RNA polymerase III subunit RPC8 isoform X2 [Papilio xuthus]|uniref:DNA-directed RNA polymerase III subunit RPC8 isoform X2 n=1 Tax=Papilio xuthus TaxID=66420 RepID=A0AAJ7ED17_PAPXU|nr:PREDICTED: DNA-directed RNA polymerase III subunit RPC8 isoform X2 [Papilio xuthus]
MFVLSEMKDVIRVTPEHFHQSLSESITTLLNRKLANKHPSRFDETDQAWVWEYPKGEGEKHDLFMDSGESIRFRVTSEVFEESLPTGPLGTECPVQTIAPYRIIGGINEPGLGLLTWWEAQEQNDVGNDIDDQENDE